MGKNEKPKKENKKKEFRNLISTKLEVALADIKTGLDANKFSEALKKGSKLLSRLLFVKKKKEKKIKKKKANTKTESPGNTGQ